MKSERNTVMECLRIISVIGIIGLHIYGEIRSEISFSNKLIEMLWSHIFAMAVPFFILISGWYSVSFKYSKLVKIHLLTLFYSVMLFAAEYYVIGGQSWREAVKAVFPILTQRYWYFSCYFVLIIFSGLLNWIVDHLPQEMLLFGLLIWMVLICGPVCIPWFEFVHDYLWVMLFYYIAGRYLRRFGVNLFHKKWSYLMMGLLVLLFSYAFDLCVSFIIGRGVAWLAASNFALKEVSVIFIFYYFTKKEFHVSFINFVSSFVPAVYAGEQFFRIVFDTKNKLIIYNKSPWLVVFVILWSIGIFILAALVELVRRLLFGKLEDIYAGMNEKIIFKTTKEVYGKIKNKLIFHSEEN